MTGASDLHTVFSPEVLPGVLQAYMVGLKATFAVAVAFSGVAVVSCLAIPYGKLPTHQTGGPPKMMAMA